MRRALTVPLTNCVVFLCSTLLEVIDSVWIRHGCTVLLPKNGLVFYLQSALCAAGGSWHSSPSRYSMVTAGQGIGVGVLCRVWRRCHGAFCWICELTVRRGSIG